MSFPRYPKYKNSGFEWLGEVPEHWEIPPLYLRYNAVLGKMLDERRLTRTHLLPYLRNADVQWDRVNVEELPELDIAPDEIERFTLKLGDILICEGGEVGRTAIWRDELEQCAFQKAIHRLRPLSDLEHTRFFFYCMSFAASTGVFLAEGNPNTIPHLTGEKLRRYRFPTPPHIEQLRIADFLDEETAKIDELVAEQRRLIDLLKEKRQAVISHAVTKGLNTDVPLKPSGIEWLGDIPEHWSMERGRFLYKERLSPPEEDDGVVTSFRDGQVTLRTNRRTEGFTLATLEVGYQRVHAGDLVIHGMDAFAGAVGVSDSTGKCTPEYSVLVPTREGIENPYFAKLIRLMALRNFIYVICPSVRERAPRFRFTSFKDVWLPVPPLHEQVAIVRQIESAADQFDALISEAERAIELLQERRTALISAAVTGKFDVRKFHLKESKA